MSLKQVGPAAQSFLGERRAVEPTDGAGLYASNNPPCAGRAPAHIDRRDVTIRALSRQHTASRRWREGLSTGRATINFCARSHQLSANGWRTAGARANTTSENESNETNCSAGISCPSRRMWQRHRSDRPFQWDVGWYHCLRDGYPARSAGILADRKRGVGHRNCHGVRVECGADVQRHVGASLREPPHHLAIRLRHVQRYVRVQRQRRGRNLRGRHDIGVGPEKAVAAGDAAIAGFCDGRTPNDQDQTVNRPFRGSSPSSRVSDTWAAGIKRLGPSRKGWALLLLGVVPKRSERASWK
jgi:hypothetical protein